MRNFGKFCLMFIILIISIFINGFVFIKLYEWFIISPFQAPKLSFAQAIGIMLFIGYLKNKSKIDKEDKSIEDCIQDCVTAIIFSLSILGLGYFTYQFV